MRIWSLLLASVLALCTGCGHVQPHLVVPDVRLGDPAFAATIVAYTEAPVVGGNRVELLLNGDDIFPAKLRAIRVARKTIDMAQYIVEDDEEAARLADALGERCRAGVRVNVLLDAIGSISIPASLQSALSGAGCRVELFRPLGPFELDRLNYRNHRRILVVDGRLGITGGSGTSNRWSGNGRREGHWRDTDVQVEGPVVEQLQGAFAENWLEATGVVLGGPDYFPRPLEHPGSARAQAVRSSPAGGSDAMYTMFLLAIRSARSSISITNPYFLPDERMIETLAETARRGVRVRMLLPGAIDHDIMRQASRSELGPLLRAGIEIYQYQAALLHAKTMVIDGAWATVGSTNFDRRSFALNDEINLVVYDRAFARRLEGVFEEDLTRARPLTYEAWRHRGIVNRLLELLASPIRSQL